MVLRARAAARLKGCGVLLVDDIRTTGATLDEARRLLEGAGAAWVAPSVACVAEIS
jgi:predicted amidophosphoribosyltransferase